MSITPKQAYEAAKVLWPNVKELKKNGMFSLGIGADIDWGDTDQYPPPEPEWVDAVFPQDVGKQGRFSDDGKAWNSGMIRGQKQNGLWILGSYSFRICQVQKVKT